MSRFEESAVSYFLQNRDSYIDSMKELLRFPTLAGRSDNMKDIQAAAAWLKVNLEKIGMQRVEIIPTPKCPVVFAEHLGAGENAPTVVIYGHYDIQPVEPLDKWISPPFEGTVRDDHFYARGTADNKGMIIAGMAAVDSILKNGDLPVNIKFLLEGEEEIGSPSIPGFLKEYKDLLKCDIILNLDAGMLDENTPTIQYGLRGIAAFELTVNGANDDLHSGLFGGVVHNPAQALCELIAGMHDKNGTIQLPGFYDSVLPIDEDEKKRLVAMPNSVEQMLVKMELPAFWGEKEFTIAERLVARPTLDVNGIIGGYTGEGGKTVIGKTASAKITTRLVPGQDPNEVHKQMRQYLEENAPDTITWDLKYTGGGTAYICDVNKKEIQAWIKTTDKIWNTKTAVFRMGGSIPISSALKDTLGVDSILAGFALLNSCNVHAPNENIHLPTWYKGVEAVIRYLFAL